MSDPAFVRTTIQQRVVNSLTTAATIGGAAILQQVANTAGNRAANLISSATNAGIDAAVDLVTSADPRYQTPTRENKRAKVALLNAGASRSKHGSPIATPHIIKRLRSRTFLRGRTVRRITKTTWRSGNAYSRKGQAARRRRYVRA
jgi:hypothetical protein